MRDEATIAHELLDAFSVFGTLGCFSSQEIAGANMCVTELFYQLFALYFLTGCGTTDSEDDFGGADKLLDVFSICFAVTFH